MKKLALVLSIFLGPLACGGSEAVSVDLAVVAGSGPSTATTTDLGYSITVDELRVAVSDIQFTAEGEESMASRVSNWFVGSAHAHPGHGGGGEVIGELLGDFVIDWSNDGSVLGTATLLTGSYSGANFLFREATAADGLAADDPLLGHHLGLAGSVSKGGDTWTLSVALDFEADTAVVGAPFSYDLTEGDSPTIALGMAAASPFDGINVFDGVEFEELDGDSDGLITVVPGEPVHNALRRGFAKHDFYFVETR